MNCLYDLLLFFHTMVSLSIGYPATNYNSLENGPSSNIKLLSYNFKNEPSKGYEFSFSQSDGQSRKEIGKIINPGTDHESIVVLGSYTYLGFDGKNYTISYIADENGFQPRKNAPNRIENIDRSSVPNIVRTTTTFRPEFIKERTQILSDTVISLSGGGLGK